MPRSTRNVGPRTQNRSDEQSERQEHDHKSQQVMASIQIIGKVIGKGLLQISSSCYQAGAMRLWHARHKEG